MAVGCEFREPVVDGGWLNEVVGVSDPFGHVFPGGLGPLSNSWHHRTAVTRKDRGAPRSERALKAYWVRP